MDCRRSLVARNIPTLGGTGLEACTWLGDIGGGTGMLSYRRVKNPETRAKDVVFKPLHDYGGTANLEGDIGGYLIARKIETNYTDAVGINSEIKYVHEVLDKYLVSDATEWRNRGKTFLQMLGGKFNNQQITNKDDLIKKISGKAAEFADFYISTRSFAKSYSFDSIKESSRHFYGAANEVASIFVDAILNIMNNPNAKLVAITDPKPSAPGEIWKKYKAIKKGQDILESAAKKGEDILRDITKKF